MNKKINNAAIYVEIVDETNKLEYRDFVLQSNRALAQHTLEWANVIESIGQDKRIYLLAKNADGVVVGAMPAWFYECDLGSILMSNPQAGGYGGIVEDNVNLSEQVYKHLIATFVYLANRKGCVLATICTPPFYGNYDFYIEYFRPDFVKDNFFQYVDLKKDILVETNSKNRNNIKRNLRIAKEYGIKVVFDNSQELFKEWYSIHMKRMNEIGAKSIPIVLFEEARKNLCNQEMGFWGYVIDNNRVIGGALFIGSGEVVDIFMMSTDSDFFQKQPNTLLVYESLVYAKEKGFSFLNWQSSSSRESNVYHFKKSWGSQEGLHYYLTKVIGDISNLKNIPLDIVKEKYIWHYVMPFEQFNNS